MWPKGHDGIDRGAPPATVADEHQVELGPLRLEPKANRSRRWVTPREPEEEEDDMPPKKTYEWEGRPWTVRDIAALHGITTVSVRRRLEQWGLQRTMTEPKNEAKSTRDKPKRKRRKVTPKPANPTKPLDNSQLDPPIVHAGDYPNVDTLPDRIVGVLEARPQVQAMRQAAVLEDLSNIARALGMRVELTDRCLVILLPEPPA